MTTQGRLQFGIIALLAEFERSLMAERVKAGMAQAEVQCKRTSQPPIPEATRRRIAELHGHGMTIKRTAKEPGIVYGTAPNYTKADLEQET